MATIKRAGNRIITKVVNGQRRVSCSCCPSDVECCMYPAQGFYDGLYTEQDLPDEIYLPPFDLSAVDQSYVGEVIQRNGTIYGPAQHPTNQRIEFVEDSFGRPIWAWYTGDFVIFDEDCLVSEIPGFQGAQRETMDLFADTYTVERRTETLTGPPDATFTITRESLCRWCGFDPLLESTICLEYNAPTFAGQGHWSIGGFGEAPPRNNSSPAGNYADGGSIWMVLEP
jgi:hypothetical protein